MKYNALREIPANVNTDSGIMNTHSGKTRKMFMLNQNPCSRSARFGVHIQPECAFRLGRNTQFIRHSTLSYIKVGTKQLENRRQP